MSVADEIEKLNVLRQSGAISEEEYQKAKDSLLGQHDTVGEQFSKAVGSISSDDNTWAMLIHLSQFCGYLVPLAGLIVPIVLWQVKKTASDVVDTHGRIVANWIISEFIYAILSFLLVLVLIGKPLLLVLLVLGIVFPIVGAIKAAKGEAWSYPLSIKFFPVN